MTSLSRDSESLLHSLSKLLRPDIPAYNKLKRSWEGLERRKFNQVMQMQHRKKEIKERLQNDLQSRSANPLVEKLGPKDVPLPDDFVRMPGVPGFRYSANGSNKKSIEDTQKDTIIRAYRGLSRYVIDKKRPQLVADKALSATDASMPATTTTEPVTTTTPAEDQVQEPPPCPKKHSRTTHFFQDEASMMRLRKVQEQLGLSPLNRDLVDPDKVLGTHPQPHNLLRSSETDLDSNKSQNKSLNNKSLNNKSLNNKSQNKSLNNKANKKSSKEELDQSQPQTSTDTSNTATGSLTNLQSRCEACRQVVCSEVRDLMRCVNPSLPNKPRWRQAPSGCYVPPPPNTVSASLFNHSFPLLSMKKKAGKKQWSPSPKAASADQLLLLSNQRASSPDRPSSVSSLQAAQRAEALSHLERVWNKNKSENKSADKESEDLSMHSPRSTNESCDVAVYKALPRKVKRAPLPPMKFQAIREKNNQEREAVQQNVQKFLQSLEELEERS